MPDTVTKPVQLTVGDVTLELPVVPATEGNDGIVVSSLLRETGLVTLDPGFMNTASCESAITYIDGDAGILRYRGYPIEQLAQHSSFLEVAYLLIHGDLPSRSELDAFVERVNRHTLVHRDFRDFIATFPPAAHPMRSCPVPSRLCRRSTRRVSTPSTRTPSSSRPSCCWPRHRPLSLGSTAARSDRRCLSPTSRSASSRTSCA